MSENPYSAPDSQSISAVAPLMPGDFRPLFKEIVIGWEKLRLLYNGLLLIPGLLIVIPSWSMIGVASVFGCILVAIGANACFFMGPVAELYIRSFFYPIRSTLLRRILFAAGLLFSLAFFGLIALGMYVNIPDQP